MKNRQLSTFRVLLTAKMAGPGGDPQVKTVFWCSVSDAMNTVSNYYNYYNKPINSGVFSIYSV